MVSCDKNVRNPLGFEDEREYIVSHEGTDQKDAECSTLMQYIVIRLVRLL